MTKNKSETKGKKKSSQLVIRLDKAERDAFVVLCERLDTSAAREIRRFMREFVANTAREAPVADAQAEAIEVAPVVADAPKKPRAVSREPAAKAEAEAEAVAPAASAEKPKRKPRAVKE